MISRTPYDRFSQEEMILRDHLATDRTILANERTLLSYVGTALGLMAAGFTLAHFIEGAGTMLLGWLLVGTGVAMLGFGFVRYRRMAQRIHWVYRPVVDREPGQP